MNRNYFPLPFAASIFFLLCLALPIKMLAAIQITAGPEIYYMQRKREGGSHQEGRMDGARVILERIKPWGIYLALDAFYATGELRGKNRLGRKLSSEMKDTIAEIRAGYTFATPQQTSLPQNCCPTSSLTAFAGYGHFHETNDFFPPSPLPFTFTDEFNYFLAGFLTSLNFTPLLSMGFNFEIKCMQKGTCRISNDPESPEITLAMSNELQARVELPIVVGFSPCSHFSCELTPFYEFRHFGGQEGFPFNFIDTKFQLIGARMALKYRF